MEDVRAKRSIDGQVVSLLLAGLSCAVTLGRRAVEAGKQVAWVAVLVPVLGPLVLLTWDWGCATSAISLCRCLSPARGQ